MSSQWSRVSLVVLAGHPNNNNHNFMKKMKLKTILVLCIEEVSVRLSHKDFAFALLSWFSFTRVQPLQGNEQFYQDSGIQVLEFGAFVETLFGSFNYFQTCEVKLTADLVSHRNWGKQGTVREHARGRKNYSQLKMSSVPHSRWRRVSDPISCLTNSFKPIVGHKKSASGPAGREISSYSNSLQQGPFVHCFNLCGYPICVRAIFRFSWLFPNVLLWRHRASTELAVSLGV